MNINGVIEQLIFPPGGFIFLSLLGLFIMRKNQRVGFYIAVSSLSLLCIASLPVTAQILMSWLEPETVISAKNLASTVQNQDKAPQAIVILGASRRYNTPEFDGDTPNAAALERIRYGVWLARRTLLPILLTGGLGNKYSLSEAELMKQLIESEYALPVRWLETRSRSTHENAKFSSEILKADGIESIYLVTHALHMKRSVMSFEKFGLTIHPAPTAFYSSSQRDMDLRDFLPKAKALKKTTQVLHEWVGMFWYWIRY